MSKLQAGTKVIQTRQTELRVQGQLRRYRRSRLSRRRSLLVFSLAAAITVLAFTAARWAPAPRPVPVAELDSDPQTVEDPTRPVYPYSVIPGGVESSDELQNFLAGDKVAALHYGGFQVNRAVLVRVREDRLAYVSYRSQGRIYWTSSRLHIRARELLVTDGVNYARSRCGNRISDVPQKPVLGDEPTEEALLYLPPPVSNKLLKFPGDMDFPPGLQSETRLPELPNPPSIVTRREIAMYPGSPSPRVVFPGAPATRTPGATPEPATILTVGIALFVSLGWRKRYRS